MEGRMTEQTKGGFAIGQFQVRQFAWSKEILNGVVMGKAAKPKNHDFEYTGLRASASTTRLTRVS
jgi:hypothetical protein